jgi:PD-(D/E)XK endonuclease
MGSLKGASRGRISTRWRSSVRKAARARKHEVFDQGELGEAAFVHKAVSLGFVVAKPHGQNHRYDFIVEAGKNLLRVQIKSCAHARNGYYKVGVGCSLNGTRIAYADTELDFVVAYIIPEETWYVVPVREVVGRVTLRFRSPNGVHHRDPYVYYREAWHLLREPDGLTFG